MDDKKANKELDKEQAKAADTLPGAAVDIADNCCVSEKLVKEETELINNNPRDEGE